MRIQVRCTDINVVKDILKILTKHGYFYYGLTDEDKVVRQLECDWRELRLPGRGDVLMDIEDTYFNTIGYGMRNLRVACLRDTTLLEVLKTQGCVCLNLGGSYESDV